MVSAATLTSIAMEFSPRYQGHRDDLVSIDVRGLERLLGTPRTIAQELRREAADRGARVHVAVAGTRMAALVLALARPGVTVVDPGEEAAALATVHIDILEKLNKIDNGDTRAFAALSIVKQWGIRTLGELAALPAPDLAARLGRQGPAWQAIARGEDLHPFVPDRPEERFESSLELEWPIEGLEPLSFVLTRLLEPLATRLERRDRGAAVFHVSLRLVTREVHVRRLELPSPMRDVRTLRALALLDLESHPPAAAIDRCSSINSRRRTLPGPMARSGPNSMRRVNFAMGVMSCSRLQLAVAGAIGNAPTLKAIVAFGRRGRQRRLGTHDAGLETGRGIPLVAVSP